MTSYSDQQAQENREIIMDHYKNPRHKGLPDEAALPRYRVVHLKNPSCGDDVAVALSLKDSKITDIRHAGTGCSICCASASMLCERINGQSAQQANACIDEFEKMMTRQPYDEELLEDAASLQGVSDLLPRIKCATLAWKAAQAALEQGEPAVEGGK